MKNRARLIFLFCFYGVLKSFKPSMPYFSPYLVNTKKFRNEEIVNDLFPIVQLVYLPLSFFVSNFTHKLGYRNLITLEAICSTIVPLLFLCGEERNWHFVIPAEVIYGISSACSVGYFSYVYQLFEKKDYQMITSWTWICFLLSKFASGIAGQLLVKYGFQYETLFIISAVGGGLSLIVALLIPRKDQYANASVGFSLFTKSYSKKIFSFSFLSVALWLCLNSIQPIVSSIWLEIDPIQGIKHNGVIDAFSKISSAIGAYLPNLYTSNKLHITASFSFFTVIVFTIQAVRNLIVMYALNISFDFFGNLTHAMIRVQLACAIEERNYAQIFGLNSFVTLILQNCINFVCSIFGLSIWWRLLALGAFALLAVLVFVVLAFLSEQTPNELILIGPENDKENNS